MHPKKIREQMTTTTAYQHICQLQLQKAQTNHDFSDLLKHYKDKIVEYDTQLIKLEEKFFGNGLIGGKTEAEFCDAAAAVVSLVPLSGVLTFSPFSGLASIGIKIS